MPRGFWFPFEEGTFWVPLRGAGGGSGEERALSLVGRIAPGVTREAVAAEAEVLVRRMDEAAGTEGESRWARTASLDEARSPSDRSFFLVLQAVVLAILLIACSNVAGLALVRVVGRRRDTAIRAAVGASRWQLLQPLLAENLLVAAAALAAGVGASLLLLRGVLASLPASTPLRDLVDVNPNPRLLAMALALAAVSLLLCTVLPALQATRADLGLVLKEDGGASGRRTFATRVRGLVVVLQIAISVVLLVCSGVLLDYVARANAWEPGYASEDLLTMPLQVDESPEGRRPLAPVAGAVLQELSGRPLVDAVAVETRFIPAGGQVSAAAGERGAVCRCVEVSQGFLRALGFP